MTYSDILDWIKQNLGPYIQKALAARPGTIYSEEWLAAITCREVGGLIARYIPQKIDVLVVCSLLRGDFSQRPGETEKQYHGYGPTQFDISSFPEFIKSGDWKDPLKCYILTIDQLEAKRLYLLAKAPDLDPSLLNKYITAAWNCGQGNEVKVIDNSLDPDAYDTGHNYAAQVFQFADQYNSIS